MPQYQVPFRDIRFVRDELLDFATHYQNLAGSEDLAMDLVDTILEEAGKFAEEVLAPLNRVGDENGCTWSEKMGVTTPPGFREAYQQFIAGGWPALNAPAELGGQNLPYSVGIMLDELMGSANWAWSMYPGLSHGAIRTIAAHGTPEQKEIYLRKLIEGTWTGTMCLTEAQAGSDLGLLRTKAQPAGDGSYRISGTKIFISAGDHDMADNIVHIVLARLPDAPAGTKGISLFIVPKRLPTAEGGLKPNKVSCGGIEHKMGINGSATCVMRFDDAVGFLIGPENKGLQCMFTFMNTARLGTALQGLALGEASFQGAVTYARERLQSRSISGTKNPQGPADPIIVHPGVRNMLLTQKAFAEGSRALLYLLAMQVDLVERGNEEARQRADTILAVLTPVAKAFMTEAGYESTNLGMQVLGGHGYIRESGMEQYVRDARIATIYEGTTGIQALDLVGRKVLRSQGKMLEGLAEAAQRFCEEHANDPDAAEFIGPLAAKVELLGQLTLQIGMAAIKNRDEVGAASVDYLMCFGYVVLAYLWARMALVARKKLAEDTDGFYQAKIHTARFYFQRILPRTETLALTMRSGASNLMAMAEDKFIFWS